MKSKIDQLITSINNNQLVVVLDRFHLIFSPRNESNRNRNSDDNSTIPPLLNITLRVYESTLSKCRKLYFCRRASAKSRKRSKNLTRRNECLERILWVDGQTRNFRGNRCVACRVHGFVKLRQCSRVCSRKKKKNRRIPLARHALFSLLVDS